MIDVTLDSAGEVVVTDEVMHATERPNPRGVRLPDGSIIYWSGYEWVARLCGGNCVGSGVSSKLGMPAPGAERLHAVALSMLAKIDVVRESWMRAKLAAVASVRAAEVELEARKVAASTVVRRALACKHAHTKEEVRGYDGGVATRAAAINPRAAGGVCIVTTCIDCGSVKRTNSNGGETEVGPWWLVATDELIAGTARATALAIFRRELAAKVR